MIKVRLLQPGQPDVEVTVEGDSAVIGRDAKCDVVVPQAFVSKRHVQILKGLVLVDLRSSNGTFVKGEKVTKPVLLEDGLFNLSDRLDVAVEVGERQRTESSLSTGQVDDMALVREQLASERARAAVLTGELAALRKSSRADGDEGARKASAGEAENADLRRRLATLKEEVEGRETEAAASLQVRLAQEELQVVQRKNRELLERLRGLEAGGVAPGTAGEPAARDEELERLRAERDAARQRVLPPSQIFTEMQKEILELRARLERFEGGEAGPALPASELFHQLQSENRELRRRLEELEAAPPSKLRTRSGAREGTKAGTAELERLAAEKARAEAELARLRRERGREGSGAAPGARAALLEVARGLVERDSEKLAATAEASPEEFLAVQALCFVRNAERVITRVAGEFIQLYDLKTLLPNVEGNLRSLTRRFLEDPEDAGIRAELTRYVEELGRWLVASVGAPRKAAREFAAELKQELSEEALTRARPIPALRKVAGQQEAELWRRACEHLRELSDEGIEDRLEKLGRKTAQELLGF